MTGPELDDEDVRQALAYAAANLDDQVPAIHDFLQRIISRILSESFDSHVRLLRAAPSPAGGAKEGTQLNAV